MWASSSRWCNPGKYMLTSRPPFHRLMNRGKIWVRLRARTETMKMAAIRAIKDRNNNCQETLATIISPGEDLPNLKELKVVTVTTEFNKRTSIRSWPTVYKTRIKRRREPPESAAIKPTSPTVACRANSQGRRIPRDIQIQMSTRYSYNRSIKVTYLQREHWPFQRNPHFWINSVAIIWHLRIGRRLTMLL